MEHPSIIVQNLSKVYHIGHEQVTAIDHIDLNIRQGQVCCIAGASGSGKSTLLHQLAGLEKPTSGTVHIGRHNISAMPEDMLVRFRQRYIGFIFQSYHLMPAMSALENVCLPLAFRGIDKPQRERMAKSMLEKVGLGNRLRHLPSQMSGGQQQRVGIARAFVTKPKIVFADEPTGNLDTSTTQEIMAMMVRFAREQQQTLILVTHELELASYADRVITLVDGRIVQDQLTSVSQTKGAYADEEKR